MSVSPPLGHVTSSGGIRTGGQEHFYLETQSVLVVPAGEEMEFKVYASTQWPTLVQVCSLKVSLAQTVPAMVLTRFPEAG